MPNPKPRQRKSKRIYIVIRKNTQVALEGKYKIQAAILNVPKKDMYNNKRYFSKTLNKIGKTKIKRRNMAKSIICLIPALGGTGQMKSFGGCGTENTNFEANYSYFFLQ